MTASKILPYLLADLTANNERRKAIILYSVGDSNIAGVNTGLVNPKASATGKFFLRDSSNTGLLPYTLERSNLQAHNSPYPDLADTVFDLVGVTVLHIQLARAGSTMVAEHQADQQNPNKHFDLSTPAKQAVSLFGPDNEIAGRDTIIPLSKGLIDLCPGYEVIGSFLLLGGGIFDADNTLGDTAAAAAYANRLGLVADFIGADYTVFFKTYAEGVDLNAAVANIPKIDSIRAAQDTFIGSRSDVTLAVDPVFSGTSLSDLAVDTDGSYVSGGSLLDDKHLSDAMMTACGISVGKVIANLCTNYPGISLL